MLIIMAGSKDELKRRVLLEGVITQPAPRPGSITQPYAGW